MLDCRMCGIGIQSVILRRECFDGVGIFDESFPRFINQESPVRLAQYCEAAHISEPLVKYSETGRISSNHGAYPVARRMVLEKHYEAVRDNKAFLIRQYLVIGDSFCALGQRALGREYLLKAMRVQPVSKRGLMACARVCFGRKVYGWRMACLGKLKASASEQPVTAFGGPPHMQRLGTRPRPQMMLLRRMLRPIKCAVWDVCRNISVSLLLPFCKPMRLAALYLYADTARYPTAYADLSFLLKRLKGFKITVVKIDNLHEDKPQTQEGPGIYDIGGDNRYWEFSGWQKGLRFLEAKTLEPDVVLFVNDSFLNRSSVGCDMNRYTSRVNSLTLRGVKGALGFINSHEEQEVLLGYDVSSWIRTCLFVLPYSVARQVNLCALDDQTIDEILPKTYSDQVINDTDKVNQALRVFLKRWITKGWARAQEPAAENWGHLRGKLTAILNERLLTAQLRRLGIPIKPM